MKEMIMKTLSTLSKYAGVFFLTAAMALPAQASEKQDAARDRVKTALNEMVRDVKDAESPAEKRAVMERFLDKAERGAGMAENLPFLSGEKRAALHMLQAKFNGYSAELAGAGSKGVPDGELDAYASFMQQNLEQAESDWGGGGIYLSFGAVIIILLILVLFT